MHVHNKSIINYSVPHLDVVALSKICNPSSIQGLLHLMRNGSLRCHKGGLEI